MNMEHMMRVAKVNKSLLTTVLVVALLCGCLSKNKPHSEYCRFAKQIASAEELDSFFTVEGRQQLERPFPSSNDSVVKRHLKERIIKFCNGQAYAKYKTDTSIMVCDIDNFGSCIIITKRSGRWLVSGYLAGK